MDSFVLYKGKKIHYTFIEKGVGKSTWVCLHGYLEDKSMWLDFFKGRDPPYNILLIDLPGHGESESIAAVNTMDEMAFSVNAVLDSLSVSEAIFIGHSMGGYVSLAFTEAFLAKVKGLCLFHSTAASDSQEKKAIRLKSIDTIKADFNRFVSLSIPNLFASGNLIRLSDSVKQVMQVALRTPVSGVLAATYGMVQRSDRTHVISQTTVPKSYIIGMQDKLIDLSLVEKQIAADGKNTRSLWLEDVGHMGFLEAPDLCYQELLDFSNSI